MAITYSAYEAKARLAEILRLVRQGRHVTITHRGHPVAEVRPIEAAHDHVAHRIESMVEQGLIVRPRGPANFAAMAARPGALARFLEDRE